MLVAEGHRFEGKDSFTGSVHRFNCILESRRRGNCAKATVGTRNDLYAIGKKRSIDSGYKCRGLSSYSADSDLIRAVWTSVADIDVVTAKGVAGSCINTDRNIVATTCVILKGADAEGGVRIAFLILT